MKKLPYTSEPGPRTSRWVGTDTKENFLENWNDHAKRRILVSQGYNDPDAIEYEFDENGFRVTPKVNEDSKFFLALGCSNTFGVGLNVNNTWPTLLAHDLNMNAFNAGVGGASIDNAFRIARDLVPELKPEVVFHFTTHDDRWEIISEFIFGGHPYQYGAWDFIAEQEGSWDSNDEEKRLLEAFTRLTCNEATTELHVEKNRLAIAHICYLNNIPYIEITLNDTREGNYSALARDLKHRGRDFQHDVAKMMYNKYQSMNEK